MKDVSYAAAFEPQPEGGYTVTFPEVPGAIAEGDDRDEAWRNAREALELVLEALIEAGEPLPERRPIEVIAKMVQPNVVVALVNAAVRDRATRINITIDQALLERVNREVDARGQSRSAFFAEAARRVLRDA